MGSACPGPTPRPAAKASAPRSAARNPRCDECPLITTCHWVARGKPAHDGPPKKTQKFEGTDRQEMIRLLTVEMKAAARALEFEKAASLRDRLEELKEQKL